MKIIASYSIKGGVGKTAASVNLAYAAARSGYKTLLVDLDPQGASSFYFRTGESKKGKGLFFSPKKKRLLRNVKGSNYKKLDILPANLSFRNFDIMLNSMHKSKIRLKEILKPLKNEYDLIVLDCPPNLTLLAENIFNASDIIVVPVIPTTLSERTLEQLLGFFSMKEYKKRKIYPFFSMAQSDNKLHVDTMKSMKRKYSRCMKSVIGFSSEIERMGVHRAPVLAYTSKKSPAQSYNSLFDEIVSVLDKK